jgi:TonB family protein
MAPGEARASPPDQSQERMVSEADTGGSPMALPADLLIPRERASDEKPPWFGIVVAALLHALVLIWFFIDWSHPPALPREPEVIPVQVVFAPPPSPPAVVAPPTPPPPPAPLGYRESGPDQRTTAPPPAETLAPQAATPPPPAPEIQKPETTPPEPPPESPTALPEKPAAPAETAKPKPSKEVARLEPPKKEAETPRAPRPAPSRRLTIAPGERAETGDPYLNQLHDLIERHRLFPRVIGQLGLPVEGTAVYDVAVDRTGRIMDIRLQRSSGTPGIDHAVADMIRNSLPFPPLPANYPEEVSITVAIHLFPPS